MIDDDPIMTTGILHGCDMMVGQNVKRCTTDGIHRAHEISGAEKCGETREGISAVEGLSVFVIKVVNDQQHHLLILHR